MKHFTRFFVLAGLIALFSSDVFFAHAAFISDKTITQTLMKMESASEDMLDAIGSKNLKKLHILNHDLRVSINRLNRLKTNGHAQGRDIALLNSWFDLISLEMKEADDFPALSNAINQFSGQLIVATHFEYEYRKDIAWMDYLGRELLLLNEYPSESAHHGALIQVRKAELQTTWNRIKTVASRKKGGNMLIQKVNPTIQSILKEANTSTLVSLSKKELSLVDDIETFFHIN